MYKIKQHYFERNSHLSTRNTNGRALLQDPRFHIDTNNDGIPGIEDAIWENLELAREHGYVLELFPFLETKLLPMCHEAVKQVVDDVCLEDLDAFTVRHLLGFPFYSDVER